MYFKDNKFTRSLYRGNLLSSITKGFFLGFMIMLFTMFILVPIVSTLAGEGIPNDLFSFGFTVALFGGILEAVISGFTFAKAKRVFLNNDKMKTINNSSQETEFDEISFQKDILKGITKPNKIKKRRDKKGQPYLCYEFPKFHCQIHIHFIDEKLINYSRGKIKLDGKPVDDFIPLNNQTIVLMLEQFKDHNVIVVDQ